MSALNPYICANNFRLGGSVSSSLAKKFESKRQRRDDVSFKIFGICHRMYLKNCWNLKSPVHDPLYPLSPLSPLLLKSP